MEAELEAKASNVVKTSVSTLSGKYKRSPAAVPARLLIALLAEVAAADTPDGPP